jgi:hypothetical protein
LFPVPDIDASFKHLGHPLILPAKDRSWKDMFLASDFWVFDYNTRKLILC